MSSSDSPLPEGWHDKLFKEADLDGAFDMLDGQDHFFAEAMRGYLRSLQLRFDDAWHHLDRAVEISIKTEESVPNLVRRFLLEIHRFETALVECPVPTEEILAGPSPDVPDFILEAYPEVKYVLDVRKACEAKLLLHMGECEEAAEIYTELIDNNPDTRASNLATYYINLAACLHGQGLHREAQVNLENAGLAVATTSDVFNAVRCGTTLFAAYKSLGDEDQAREWHSFVLKLKCPQATKDLFERRAKRLLLESGLPSC